MSEEMREILGKLRKLDEASAWDTPRDKKRQTTKVSRLIHKISGQNPVYDQLMGKPVKSVINRTGTGAVSYKYGTFRGGGNELAYLMFEGASGEWGLIYTVLDSGEIYEVKGDKDSVKSAFSAAKSSMTDVDVPDSKNPGGGFYAEAGPDLWKQVFMELKNRTQGKYTDSEIATFMDSDTGGRELYRAIREYGADVTRALNSMSRTLVKMMDDRAKEVRQAERDSRIY